MDNRKEAREFLVSRRAKITPEQAGLPAGTNRRVAGLRRSEVAALAGVSIEYYSKLERGALAGVSAGVLDAITRALQLDDAERAHLFDLAQAADGSSALVRPRRRAAKQWSPRPSLQWTLDAVTEGPAFVRNGRMDLLAANRLARAFYADVYADPQRPANLARFAFLDQSSRRFYPDWDLAADICVAILRTEAGRDPHDKDLQNLVGELSTRSDEFRKRWGAHNVRHHGTGAKTFHNQIVGDLTLAYEGLEMAAEPGLTLTIYTAEPGSPSEEALRLLASGVRLLRGGPRRADALHGTTPRVTCHTTTVKNDGSCSRRPETATCNVARAMPPSVCRSSGSSVRLPATRPPGASRWSRCATTYRPYRHMTAEMQARVVAVIGDRLAVALAAMPQVCPKARTAEGAPR